MRLFAACIFSIVFSAASPVSAQCVNDGGRLVQYTNDGRVLPCVGGSQADQRGERSRSAGSPRRAFATPVLKTFDTTGYNYFDLMIGSSCAADSNPLRKLAEQFINSAANYGFVRENRQVTINLRIKAVKPGSTTEIANVPLIDFKTDDSGQVTNARCESLLVKNLFIKQDIQLEFVVMATEGQFVVPDKVLATVRFVASLAPYVGSILQFGNTFVEKANARSADITSAATDINTYLNNFKEQKTDTEPVRMVEDVASVSFKLSDAGEFIIAKKPKAYAMFSALETLGAPNMGAIFEQETGLDLNTLVKTFVSNEASFFADDDPTVRNACRDLSVGLTGGMEAGNAKRYLTLNEASIVKWWVLKRSGVAVPERTKTICAASELENYKRWGLDYKFLESAVAPKPADPPAASNDAFGKFEVFLDKFFVEIQKAQSELRILSGTRLGDEQRKSLLDERISRIFEFLQARLEVQSHSGPLVFDVTTNVADGWTIAANVISKTSIERFGCYRRASDDLKKNGVHAEALIAVAQDGKKALINMLVGLADKGERQYAITKLVSETASTGTLRSVQKDRQEGCGDGPSGSKWKPWE